MARLPVPGSDDGMWGDILNDFLSQSHNGDGTLKDAAVSDALTYGTSANTVTEGNDARVTGAQQRNTLTTKGDMYVATGASAVTRLPVGSNGQVLQANSAQASGVQWVGLDDPQAALFGLNMLTIHPAVAASSHTLAAGTLVFVLIRSTKTQQITNLGVWLSVGGGTATGANGMALYDESGSLLRETTSMSSALTGTGYIEGTLTSALNLNISSYYIALLTHYSGPVPTIKSASVAADLPIIATHRPSLFLTAQTAFPASFNPATATVNSSYYMMGAR